MEITRSEKNKLDFAIKKWIADLKRIFGEDIKIKNISDIENLLNSFLGQKINSKEIDSKTKKEFKSLNSKIKKLDKKILLREEKIKNFKSEIKDYKKIITKQNNEILKLNSEIEKRETGNEIVEIKDDGFEIKFLLEQAQMGINYNFGLKDLEKNLEWFEEQILKDGSKLKDKYLEYFLIAKQNNLRNLYLYDPNATKYFVGLSTDKSVLKNQKTEEVKKEDPFANF